MDSWSADRSRRHRPRRIYTVTSTVSCADICCVESYLDDVQDVTEAPKNMGPDALIKQKIKQKRFREGYEEGLSTMHKPTSAAAFILSATPVEMLGQFSQIVLSGSAAESFPGAELAPDFAHFVEKHPATVEEVKALCGDLQVLGRSEFKQLLKW